MAKGTLSIFVDESGIFKYPDPLSRFYILSLVLHDQSQDISRPLADLSRGVADLGFDPEDFVFHAGPIIRKEDGYSLLSRHWKSGSSAECVPSSAMFSESLSARKSSSAEARAAERRVLQAHAEAEDGRGTVREVT